MRKLLALVVSLLLAGPAFAQLSGKGLVDNADSSGLTCDGTTRGYRVYDTALGYEVTCNGTAFVASGGTGTMGDITIVDPSPQIFLDDSSHAGANTEGQIRLNCLTPTDCDEVQSEYSGVNSVLQLEFLLSCRFLPRPRGAFP